MSSINYCTLDEAWGRTSSTTSKKGCTVYSEHKQAFEKNNPLRTPNVNYQCLEENKQDNTNISGYQKNNKYITYNNSKKSNKNNEINPPEFYQMNTENQDLFTFIKTLNLDESTTKILLSKISNAFDSIKYEDEPSNNIKEDFSQRYYQENKNVDILFLILLGIFVIFILDKK